MANILSANANLLVALDLLAQERSVSKAAKRYGITQSAMSSALARLRELFDDPILVRIGNGMQLTPRGELLAAKIRTGVAALEEALAEPVTFDPKTSRQRFVVAMSDFIEVVVLPAVLERLSSEAPHVSLQIVGWGRLDPPLALASGPLDAAVGIFNERTPDAGWQRADLFETRFVCIARKRHPKLGERLTLSTYVNLGHVLLTEQLDDEGAVDVALRALGRTRTIALRVPHYTAVPHVVARSNLVAAIDEAVARHFAGMLPIVVHEPPLKLPTATVQMLWHERTTRDPARAWLRDTIAAAATQACVRNATVRRPRKRR